MPEGLEGAASVVADTPASVGNSSEGFSDASDLSFLDSTLATHYASADASASAAVADMNQPPAVEPSAATDAPEFAEPPVAEPQAAQPNVEAQPQVEVATAAEEFDDGTQQSLSIAALNKKMASTPALKALVDADPAFRNQLFYNARLAERSAKYDEMFQTPQLAQEVKQAAEAQFTARDHFANDPRKFLENLRSQSFERDENGQIKVDPMTGMPTDTGAYDKAMSTYRSAWYDAVAQGIQGLSASGQSIPDPSGGPAISAADMQEALRLIQIATEGSSRIPPPVFGQAQPPAGTQTVTQPQAQPVPAQQAAQRAAQLPREVQEQLAELNRIKSEQTANASKSYEDFKSGVATATRSAIETDVRNLLAKRLPANAGFSDYMKDKVVADTVAEIERVAKTNTAHQAVVGRAVRSAPRDTTGIDKIVATERAFAREVLGRKLAEVLSRATPGVVAQNKSTQAKVTAQVNRREVQSSGGVSTPSRQDVRQVARDIDTNARKAGKPLSDLDFVDAVVAAQQGR